MSFAPSAISLVGTGAQNISPPSERAIRDGLARSLRLRIPFSPQTWTTSMEDTFDTVSTRCVLKTTGKDTTMLLVIFSFLLFVILLCALWFHDVWYPPEGRAERKKWSHSLNRIS